MALYIATILLALLATILTASACWPSPRSSSPVYLHMGGVAVREVIERDRWLLAESGAKDDRDPLIQVVVREFQGFHKQNFGWDISTQWGREMMDYQGQGRTGSWRAGGFRAGIPSNQGGWQGLEASSVQTLRRGGGSEFFNLCN
jgi:hypothetical protein